MPEFYRISPPPYTTAEQAFSGEGSFNYGGRFNAKNGHHVVYASDSLALAAIETMANVGDFAELEQMVYFKTTVEEAQTRTCPPGRPSCGVEVVALPPGDAGDRRRMGPGSAKPGSLRAVRGVARGP